MKRALFILPLFAATLALAHQAWQTVSAADAGFSISMPGKPAVSNSVETEGNIKVPMRIYLSRTTDTNYVVTVAFLPKNRPANLAANILKGVPIGFLRTTGGKKTGEKTLNLNGCFGKLITVDAANGSKGSLWMYTKGDKVYLLTLAKRSGDYAKEQQKFFGSFRLK